MSINVIDSIREWEEWGEKIKEKVIKLLFKQKLTWGRVEIKTIQIGVKGHCLLRLFSVKFRLKYYYKQGKEIKLDGKREIDEY